MKKMWLLYTVESYLAWKRKEILSFAAMSLSPEGKLSWKNQMPGDLTEQCSTPDRLEKWLPSVAVDQRKQNIG